MTYNHHQIQDLKLSDFEKQIGKVVKITLLKPTKLRGFEKEQKELTGVVQKIGLSANSPHMPVDLTIESQDNNTELNINLFKMETLEIE
ncbi:MAG: hypothetical protein R2783_08450 [Gelidibacter sp.]